MNIQKRQPRGEQTHDPTPFPHSTLDPGTPISPTDGTTSSSYLPPRSHSRPCPRSSSKSRLHKRGPSDQSLLLSAISSYIPGSRNVVIMFVFFSLCLFLLLLVSPYSAGARKASISGFRGNLHDYRRQACPDYTQYSTRPHPPYTAGEYQVPFQRPAEECRLFRSEAVEKKIQEITSKMGNPDLARLFENCFPNTLDTTVRWHLKSTDPEEVQSFIVTGDINAQWLRDSTNQLQQYHPLAKDDPALQTLLRGAINTQADYVLKSPYCNAFQPPVSSGLDPTSNGQDDIVHPVYDPNIVFECKYEIDSLASFLSLSNQYYKSSSDSSFITPKWLNAVQMVLNVIEEQSVGTFSDSGDPSDLTYTFQRKTMLGTETLNLAGIGNPLASNTSLVRSAFRPSDDACIMQFFIPGNAFMSVELGRTAQLLQSARKSPDLAKALQQKSDDIRVAVLEYGVTTHPVYGKVFAFEVDGYGSTVIMDDANLPSLLALPLLGFVDRTNEVYQNTRKMVLSRYGNPYYLVGTEFQGIGGPHIGLTHAWPISLLVQAMTSDDDDEIVKCVEAVLKVSAGLGLIHESVNVDRMTDYTRSWFAWANSVYAHTILDLAERKPALIFGPDARLGGGLKAKGTEKV